MKIKRGKGTTFYMAACLAARKDLKTQNEKLTTTDLNYSLFSFHEEFPPTDRCIEFIFKASIAQWLESFSRIKKRNKSGTIFLRGCDRVHASVA